MGQQIGIGDNYYEVGWLSGNIHVLMSIRYPFRTWKQNIYFFKSYQFVIFFFIFLLPEWAQNAEIGNGLVQIFSFLVFFGTVEIKHMTKLDGVWIWATLKIKNIYLSNIFYNKKCYKLKILLVISTY